MSSARQRVLAVFAEGEALSRRDVEERSGLSQGTVSRYLNEFIEEGLVEGIGSRRSPRRAYCRRG
ncbi:MarR family transcriptional regulator [Corynebacterium oculi]|uniref:MarR family protein n=1 Tax=Corynebacterium oculi TaxID=1544416 RepID=A0A0Q0YPM0_9CORY|nr:helix-turn-helix domain-containing protein [Corynebacterium oculi]KQB84406.1 MarR family protein [Corynebacterium oculi]